MNIWKISIQNIKSKPLYTLLSIFMLALSIGLLLAIQQLKTSFKYQMENNLGNIDMVIGAKGSPLQLVLSSILHLDNPTGNISYKEAKKIGSNPMINKAVPISYGDNYKGYRIVGTTPDFVTFYNAEAEQGALIPKSMEVVLGSAVAKKLGLKVGDTFASSHGLIENEIDVHEEEFTVVGVYKPTQKVIDRLIVTDLESVWQVHDHGHDKHSNKEDEDREHDGHEHDHGDHDHEHDHSENSEHNHDHDDDHKEITSLLVAFKNPMAILTMPRDINTNTNMQAAMPKIELDRLYQFTGIGFTTVSWIAYIILVISGLTIFISLYKMIKERAFDLALMRTYGASNSQLIKMVTYEGVMIVILAFVLGLLLSNVCLNLMSNFIETNNQQSILQPLPMAQVLEIVGVVFVMIILSIAFAIYPIIKMNISTILSNEK